MNGQQVRDILAEHIDKESIERLRTLLTALAPANEPVTEPPVEAIDVVRAVAVAHIHHIRVHAARLSELAAMLAATLRDPRRAFHAGQLNVATMVAGRLVNTTARVCVDQILNDEDEDTADIHPTN